jgi:uncharacterized protein (DUF2384 family)
VPSKTAWLTAVLVSSLLGSLGGYLATSRTLEEPLQKLSLTTPVFVLDRVHWVKAIPPDATPEVMAKAMNEWRHKADQLARAGYLVLDSGMVVAAPEDVYVHAEK